ncbi:glycosyl hydrolase family 76 [Diplocarpon rosae]|nr:glycosyl hydrolase family 76 [Diplocarpon rosae]
MFYIFVSRAAAAVLLIGYLGGGSAIQVDLTNPASIKDTAATLAYDMMSYYKGNHSGGIIGVLPGPPPNPPDGYYWWESGAMWGTLIDYWHYTGDTSYNDVVAAGIQAQVGENLDMMPRNWSQSMGNDDQGFWGMTAMSAAETNFQNPLNGSPGWLALAQAVFNTQARRPDDTCGGGLRWQVYPYLTGYDYKNSIANGCFFNIAARLARYTENNTYYEHAVSTWDWITNIGFIDKDYNVYDGGHIEYNCTDINHVQFSYNIAVWLLGAANMYNYTNGSSVWENRVSLLLNSTFNTFFPNDIAYEIACEPKLTCTTDMYSFKAFVTRWLAATSVVAPFTRDLIMPKLLASATAAAKQCSGPPLGRTCGLSWPKGEIWDGTSGVGQQMAAMSALFVNLLPLQEITAPVTNATGGTSVGNPDAGAHSVVDLTGLEPPSSSDRVGAGIFTAILLLWITGMFGWMSLGD